MPGHAEARGAAERTLAREKGEGITCPIPFRSTTAIRAPCNAPAKADSEDDEGGSSRKAI